MPHQCLALALQSTAHTSCIFGSLQLGAQDVLGARDTPSLLLNLREFPIAEEPVA